MEIIHSDRASIWARSTLEQLLSRQVARASQPHEFPCGDRGPGRRSGVFRPGLRVVAIEEPVGRRGVDPWLDHPSGMIVEG